MAEYRDYGALGNATAPNVKVSDKKYTQVYQATHKGEKYLPFMERSFISFSYGGKNIEDFNLIATIEGDSLSRNAYSEFNDNVTELDTHDGQLYWGSHYKANNLELILATDGMTQQNVEDFKVYFRPGIVRELILSEHPNRAIDARVAAVPVLDLLPFEEEQVAKIAGQDYKTKTTLYKGSIKLNFVMDEPFWHSIRNILNVKEEKVYKINNEEIREEIYTDKWINANNEKVDIKEDKDVSKIVLEDGVPTIDMLYSEHLKIKNVEIERLDYRFLFGTGGTLLNNEVTDNGSRISEKDNGPGARINQGHVAYYKIDGKYPINLAVPTENVIKENEEDDKINTQFWFYYPGTAPCAPILKFSFAPSISSADDSTRNYIIRPLNSFGSTDRKYSTIVFKGPNGKKYFRFTTPGVYTGYNQAIKIFKESYGKTIEQVREQLRDDVKHWAPRNYANQVLNNLAKESGNVSNNIITSTGVTQFQIGMKEFIPSGEKGEYEFNSKTGKATAKIPLCLQYNKSTATKLEENVGDMVKSDYLIIEGKNYPNNDGYVVKRTTKNGNETYQVYADIALYNVDILYKYMYL